MREVELAWLAGIVDGEGSITIRKGQVNKGQVQLSVGNTYKEAIDKIKEMTGFGYVRLLHRDLERPFYKKSKTHKPCYQWKVVSNQACSALRPLLPYLVIKKEQAILALKYQEILSEQGRGRPGGIDQSFFIRRDEIRDKISKLNHGVI